MQAEFKKPIDLMVEFKLKKKKLISLFCLPKINMFLKSKHHYTKYFPIFFFGLKL